jgi:hypothetical protein
MEPSSAVIRNLREVMTVASGQRGDDAEGDTERTNAIRDE